jgi:hypothetical protein
MTSMPPPGGDASSDGSWSYRASGLQKRASRKPTSVVPAAPPAASPPTPPSNGAGLEPLSKRLLEVAAGLSVLLILIAVVAWLHGSDEASFNPIAQAAARTQQQPGSRIALSGTYSLPTGQTMAMHGYGVYNGGTGHSRSVIEVAVPGPVGSIRMEGVGDMKLIYMRSKLISAGIPPGDRWLAIQPGLGGAGQTAIANNTGSEGQLEMLRATGGDVENLGEAEVRGVTTTRYAGTLDLSRYAGHLADEGKGTAAHEYEQLAKAMPAPIPVEAWLDDAGLVRQMRMVMPIPSENGDPEVKMDMTMAFFDFGAAPKIDLPDRGEVFDATPLSRARLHLLDGSAIGVPAAIGDGPPLSQAAFHRRATRICKEPDAAVANLKKIGEPLGRKIKVLGQLAKPGNGDRNALLRVLDEYGERYLEPVMQQGVHAMRRLAALSPPPALRASVQRFLHFGSIAIEVDLAQTRALEIGSIDTVKSLKDQLKTAVRKAKQAAMAAHLGACNEKPSSTS